MKPKMWLFYSYLFIYRFEKYFSRKPREIFHQWLNSSEEPDGRWKHRFFRRYEAASKMKIAMPLESEKKFNSLLQELQSHEIPKRENIEAKIYFHLALLTMDELKRKENLEKCLAVLPAHKKARELYNSLSSENQDK